LLRAEGKSIFLFSKYIYIYKHLYIFSNTFSQHNISPERYTRTRYIYRLHRVSLIRPCHTHDTQSLIARTLAFNIFRSKRSSGHVHGDNRKVNVYHKPGSTVNAYRTQWWFPIFRMYIQCGYIILRPFILLYGIIIIIMIRVYLYSKYGISPRDPHVRTRACKK